MARSGYTPMASRRAAWKTPFAVSAPRPWAHAGRSQAILARPRIAFSSVDQAEFREALQELRRGRDVDVEGTGDLAREVPMRVAKGPQDGEAVLAGEEHDGSLERLLVHRRMPSSERA